MTIDVALAAFTIAFAFYWRTGAWTKLFVVLVLACLVRETGVFLVGGCCLVELINRRLVRAVIWASTALPAFVWYLFLRARPLNPFAIAAAMFVVLVFMLTQVTYWNDVNAYARVF